MMLTLFNSLQQINEYADEITYRMSGKVEMAGGADIHVSTMLAPQRSAGPRRLWCSPAGGATNSIACS